MKVSVQDGKGCERILTVEVGGDEIQKEYNEFYGNIAVRAKIPGFRPGKAPRKVLEMHYQNEAREHVLKHLVSESYERAVQEKALEPLTYPEFRDVKLNNSELSYKAVVEVRPKIKLARVAGLAAKKEKAEIKGEEIEQGLKRVQESLAQYKAVEGRPAALGDFVIADYTCFVGGAEVEKRSDDWFELREDEFIKGFSAQLIGAAPGDERELQVTFPEKMANPKLAGKPGVFKVKVKELKTKVLPPMTDDLAREAGEYQSLEELKGRIQNDLLNAKEHEKEKEFEDALLEELMKQNKFELPEGFVKRRKEYLMKHAREDFRKHGLQDAEFEKKKDELEAGFEKEARRQVHLAFLLNEIAVRENITVSEEDLKQQYERVAKRVRQNADQVAEYYNKDSEALEALRDQIRQEKTIHYIKQHAKQK